MGCLGGFNSFQVDGLLHTQRIALTDNVRARDVAAKIERREEAESLTGVPAYNHSLSA